MKYFYRIMSCLTSIAMVLLYAITPTPASAAGSTRCGIDYAWYRPSDYQLASTGCSTVARYILPEWSSNGKDMDYSERAHLHALGYQIVLVYELWANRALDGYDAGVLDAKNALTGAQRAGLPRDSNVVIYLAIDWDITPAQKPAAAQYTRGFASVLGWNRTGAYGGYWALKYLFENTPLQWGWQTYAWSGGLWHPKANFRQDSNGYYWGGQGDHNTITGATGAWRPDGSADGAGAYVTAPSLPSPTPVPVAPSGGAYTVRSGDTLSGIASRYGTTWQAVWAANRWISNPNFIRIGWTLTLPGGVASNSGGKVLTVRSGDYLAKLAPQCPTSWSALYNANRSTIGSNPNMVYPGQRLRCP